MTEIAVVLILALVFLGPKKLPELASGLGKMIREIKKVTAGVKEEIQLDENIRKPFDELREAIQLPAAELKRRDEWKAEWERRQEEEAAQAAIEAAKPAEVDGTADATNVTSDLSSTSDPFANTVYAGDSNADATMISATPAADKTIAAASPLHVEPTLAAHAPSTGPLPVPGPPPAAPSAPVAPSAAVLPPAPRLPTAPPPGAIATGGRTIVGVVPASTVAAAPSRPTPPPPPPAASRLPAPKVPARSVPAPLADDEPGDEKKPA